MANDSTSPDSPARTRGVDEQPTAPGRVVDPVAGRRPGFSWRGLIVAPWLFVVLAAMLLTTLICLGLLIVVAASYVGTEDAPQRMLDRGWALLASLAMLWAVVNLYWSNRAARHAESSAQSQAVFGHFAIAIGCGLIAIGLHSMSIARAFGTQPIVMDHSHPYRQANETGSVASVVIAGDAEEGRKVFSTTCITCHGPTGDGLPNLAPSLRGSPFVASADDAAIAGVIRLGRAATDPNNKTKKVMPARGGNPFLGDDKIAHLVAFVRAIQSESPVASGTADPNAPPPVQLAKWVVPTAPSPPTGMISLLNDDIGDDVSLASRTQSRKSGLVKTFTLALTGIHCLLLVGVMVTSGNALIRGLQAEAVETDESLWTWSTLGWIAAVVVWLVVFVIGFLIL